MVQAAGLRKKFRALPEVIENTLRKQFEKEATRLVGEMSVYLQIQWPNVAKHIEIDWTWGDAPAGSVSVGQVGNNEFDQISISIYARAKSGSGFSATWFEFGTGERVQQTTGRRTGRITAGSFFYSAYRAGKARVKTNVRAALRRAIKKLNT